MKIGKKEKWPINNLALWFYILFRDYAPVLFHIEKLSIYIHYMCVYVNNFEKIINGLCTPKSTHFFFFYSYVHTMLGSFLPPSPPPLTISPPPPSPPTPSIPGRNYFALISNFVEERV
jgi:hypothetical protein